MKMILGLLHQKGSSLAQEEANEKEHQQHGCWIQHDAQFFRIEVPCW
jgi:hypothetical protein